jgi:hypothetical protein
MELTRVSQINVALENAWRRIVASDLQFYVYVDRKHQIECLREDTNACHRRQETPGFYTMVGIYNAGVRKQDFFDDVLYVVMQITRWGQS